jgi:hypothetical protein
MRERLNWFADFLADFPKTCSSDGPPGKELATFLAEGLRHRGIHVPVVQTLDIEHIVECFVGSQGFRVFVWVDDIHNIERRELCCPANVGWLGRLFGCSDHADHKRLLEAIDDILRNSEQIRDVRWFRYYECPWYRDKHPQYAGPVVPVGKSA